MHFSPIALALLSIVTLVIAQPPMSIRMRKPQQPNPDKFHEPTAKTVHIDAENDNHAVHNLVHISVQHANIANVHLEFHNHALQRIAANDRVAGHTHMANTQTRMMNEHLAFMNQNLEKAFEVAKNRAIIQSPFADRRPDDPGAGSHYSRAARHHTNEASEARRLFQESYDEAVAGRPVDSEKDSVTKFETAANHYGQSEGHKKLAAEFTTKAEEARKAIWGK